MTHDTQVPAGALGPTMNESGEIALRGPDSILRYAHGRTDVLAVLGTRYAAFHGIPVINGRGDVAFRADLVDSRSVIAVGRNGMVNHVCVCTPPARLGNFPSMNDAGEILCTRHEEGHPDQLLCIRDNQPDILLKAGDVFQSIRGGVHGQDGPVHFFATPHAGGLRVYAHPASPVCLLAVGDPMLGSTVREFAMNSASISADGGIAVRVGLADGRGVVTFSKATLSIEGRHR